eukprot:1649482-Lingulodinium_polyedra.AAC.1
MGNYDKRRQFALIGNHTGNALIPTSLFTPGPCRCIRTMAALEKQERAREQLGALAQNRARARDFAPAVGTERT